MPNIQSLDDYMAIQEVKLIMPITQSSNTWEEGSDSLDPGYVLALTGYSRSGRRRKKADRLRRYQRDRLRGFTSEELLRLQTLSSMDTTKMGQRLGGGVRGPEYRHINIKNIKIGHDPRGHEVRFDS